MIKYCRACGLELVKKELEEFDQFTGDRRSEMVCPTRKCGHTGAYHNYQSSGLIAAFFSRYTCTRCGDKLWDH